jgi:hypothetical protein
MEERRPDTSKTKQMMETTEARTSRITVTKKSCLNISEAKILGDSAVSNRLGEWITRRREDWKELFRE